MRFKVEISGAISVINKAIRDHKRIHRRVLLQFAAYMLGRTGATFKALAQGGTYRGVTWAWFKDQYTRKTDGKTVPAEGGVPKLKAKDAKGEGQKRLIKANRKKYPNRNVKGRERPSGRRVTKRSNLLRDTGRLSREAGSDFKLTDHKIIMDTQTPYAALQQAMRPFLFFEDQTDAQAFIDIARKAYEELATGRA